MIFLRFVRMLIPLLARWLPSKPELPSLEELPEQDLPAYLPGSKLWLGVSSNMLSIKSTADLRGMQPELVPAIIVANEVYGSAGYDCVITSVCDGEHTKGTLHKHGFGVDIRTKHVPVEKQAALAKEIATRLSTQYDVLLEADHLHIEFDCR